MSVYQSPLVNDRGSAVVMDSFNITTREDYYMGELDVFTLSLSLSLSLRIYRIRIAHFNLKQRKESMAGQFTFLIFNLYLNIYILVFLIYAKEISKV